MLPHLAPLWARHDHRRLVEPFCGGLAVPLGLQPKRGFLTDINPHLINFYQWLQRGLVVEIELENDEDLYYAHRARFNKMMHAGQQASKEAAELFYYLNRTGYNGLCRFNRKGEFNVPKGQYKTINYVRDFRAYQPLLSSWLFSVCAFHAVPAAPDDLIYADPPYDVEFTEYPREKIDCAERGQLTERMDATPSAGVR